MILLYCVSVYVFSFDESMNIYSKLLAACLIALLVLYTVLKQRITVDVFSVLLVLFVVYSFLSVFWTINAESTISKCLTLLQIGILSLLLYNYLALEHKLNFFVAVLCVAGIVFAAYTVLYFGIDEYFDILNSGERVGAEITNVNAIGVICSLTAVMLLWYILYRKMFVAVLPLALCVLVSLATGSRKALLAIFIGVVCLFILKGNVKQKLFYLLLCIVALILLYNVLQLPAFSLLTKRIERMFETFDTGARIDNSTYLRMRMIAEGWAQFKKTPILGIGLDNAQVVNVSVVGYNLYLHNNYIELLVSLGLVGTVIYYAMYLVPLKALAVSAVKSNRDAVLACTLIAVQLVLHFAMVAYYDKMTYMYIIIFFLTLQKQRVNRIEKTAHQGADSSCACPSGTAH